MKFRFKEMPYEASLFFLAWICIIILASCLAVCIILPSKLTVDIIFPPDISGQGLGSPIALIVCHGIFGIIYLLPAVCTGLKVRQNRKIAGLPLFICAVIIWIWGMMIYLALFAGLDFVSPAEAEYLNVISIITLMVAVPLSFGMFARSAGCRDCRNMKILKIFAVLNFFIITAVYLAGSAQSRDIIWKLSICYELFISPLLGVLYIQMMMDTHRKSDKVLI